MKCKALTSIISIVFIGTLAFHFIALAAIDAPHNESSNINCGSCHGQGLLNSPFWGGSMSYDQLCLNCHTASSGPYTETNAPLVQTHSSDNTSENYGVWSWECRNCHDAHYQKQKNYKNTDSGNLYLATGVIDGCSYNAVDNKSTLTYTSINYKAGWDATKVTEKTDAFRRTILFPNVNKLGYSYPVVAIDTPLAGTMTVSGDATPVYQYITESTFAVMYGQYVKDNINDNQVKFLDQTGINSYVDGDTTYNGVCEVCHTLTAYHRNDSSGDHTHYASETCRTCHPHLNGFGHGGATPGGDCIECHGHDAGYEYEADKFSQGRGTYTSHSTHTENDSDDLKGPNISCSDCHNTNRYPEFTDGATTLASTTVCDTCHSPNGAYDGVNDGVIGAKNNWSNGVYASPTLKAGKEQWCATCHDDEPAYGKPETIETIVIDNTDAEFVCGDWTCYSAVSGAYNDDLCSKNAGDGSCTATWRPTLAQADDYSIYAWWIGGSVARAYNTPYTIYYNGGSQTVRVNQEQSSGGWYYLGMYPFAAGTSGCVVLSDNAEGVVVADAIKLERGTGPGTYAPNVIGDNTTYGFYVTGHKIDCLSCHDSSKKHIDGEHRTYWVDEGPDPDVVVNPYSESYRLRDINGQSGLNVPVPSYEIDTTVFDHLEDYALCFDCHGIFDLLGDDNNPVGLSNFYNTQPNGWGSGGATTHRGHLSIYNNYTDSDWDSLRDSSVSCITCHNVHGSPSKVMIRHGELISTPGTTDKVGGLNFFYLTVPLYPTATATWTFNVALDSSYNVYAWWRAHENWATDSPFTVNYSGGSQTIRVNQEINGSQWNLLGNFPFVASTEGSVVLGNNVNDYNEYVVADAIKIEGAGPGGTDIIIDEELATFIGTWTYVTPRPESYNEDHSYGPKNLLLDPYALVEDSVGGRFGMGNLVTQNHICTACHPSISYYRTPYLGPRVLDGNVTPDRVINDRTGTTLITASVWDSTGDFSTMEVDLTPIGESASQQMYDDGTNGDVTPGDGVYSYLATVAAGTLDIPTNLVITATDDAANVAQAFITLDVVDHLGSIYINDSKADFVCTWTYVTGQPQQYSDDHHWHATGDGSCTATWTPNIPALGTYKVYAWWRAISNWATDAPYTIYYDGGSETIRVNQEINGGQWNLLGTYPFAAGTSGYVVLSDDANEYVVADAIKFEPVP